MIRFDEHIFSKWLGMTHQLDVDEERRPVNQPDCWRGFSGPLFFSQECNMVCAPFDGDMTFFEQLSIELLGLSLKMVASCSVEKL